MTTPSPRTQRVSPARKIAFEILLRVEREQAYAGNLLASNLTVKLSPEDRGLTHEIVLGVIRNQRRLDFLIEKLSGRKLTKLDLEVLLALRIGIYQIEYLTRIPARAAVNESVNLVKVIGKSSAAGLVNAVLRKARPGLGLESNLPAITQLGITHSHTDWLLQRWLAQTNLDWVNALAAANNTAAPLDFRLNTFIAAQAEILSRIAQAGLEIEAGKLLPTAYRLIQGSPSALLELAAQGLIYIQDEASQLVAHLVNAQPGMRVLDACAAPGGKTTAIAAEMDNQGLIVAGELHPIRARLVQENCRRLQVKNISPVCFNAAAALPLADMINFDRILIDAPCSGTGTLRRNPEIKWRLTPEKIAEMAQLQLSILENCAARLTTGGRLVYSTCSLERDEDEAVITRFLTNHPEFRLAELNLPTSLITADGFVRTWPNRDGCDGFFAAVLIRS